MGRDLLGLKTERWLGWQEKRRQKGGRQEGGMEVGRSLQETQVLFFILHAMGSQTRGPKITWAPARWEIDCWKLWQEQEHQLGAAIPQLRYGGALAKTGTEKMKRIDNLR